MIYKNPALAAPIPSPKHNAISYPTPHYPKITFLPTFDLALIPQKGQFRFLQTAQETDQPWIDQERMIRGLIVRYPYWNGMQLP
jgi:hypothetical protein